MNNTTYTNENHIQSHLESYLNNLKFWEMVKKYDQKKTLTFHFPPPSAKICQVIEKAVRLREFIATHPERSKASLRIMISKYRALMKELLLYYGRHNGYNLVHYGGHNYKFKREKIKFNKKLDIKNDEYIPNENNHKSKPTNDTSTRQLQNKLNIEPRGKIHKNIKKCQLADKIVDTIVNKSTSVQSTLENKSTTLTSRGNSELLDLPSQPLPPSFSSPPRSLFHSSSLPPVHFQPLNPSSKKISTRKKTRQLQQLQQPQQPQRSTIFTNSPNSPNSPSPSSPNLPEPPILSTPLPPWLSVSNVTN